MIFSLGHWPAFRDFDQFCGSGRNRVDAFAQKTSLFASSDVFYWTWSRFAFRNRNFSFASISKQKKIAAKFILGSGLKRFKKIKKIKNLIRGSKKILDKNLI